MSMVSKALILSYPLHEMRNEKGKLTPESGKITRSVLCLSVSLTVLMHYAQESLKRASLELQFQRASREHQESFMRAWAWA